MNRETLVPAFSGRPSTPEEVGLLNSIIAEIGDAHDALSASIAVLRRVCEATGWVLGQMWIPSQDGTALERDAVWASDPDKSLQTFVSISGQITFSLGEGFLGRVWSSKQPVWIPDVSMDRDIVRSSEARTAKFVTALGVPVVAENEVIAVLEFFTRELRPEDEQLKELVKTVAGQLGWTIRHKRAHDALRERTELLKCHNRVLEGIARGEPLRQTLDLLLRLIESQCAGMLCSILLLDPDGVHVRHGSAPSLPDSYTRAIDGEEIGPSAGSCGTAAFRREPVIVKDIETDPLWERYREFALSHGLRACWSTPIFDGQRRVLGTFALYFQTPCSPTKQHHELIEMATSTAAIAIVRYQETEALRAGEERLRLAIAGGNLGIWEWDATTDRLVLSEEIEAAFGWLHNLGDLTLKRFMEIVHPEDRNRVDSELQRSLAERTNCDLEFRYLRPSGSVRWITIKGRGEYDSAGKPKAIIGVALDSTERKRAEEQIRKSKTELQEVLDNSPALIYMKDQAGRYTFVNRRWTELFHTPREYSEGKTDFELFPEDTARQFVANDRAVVESGQTQEFEEQSLLEDGLHSCQSIKVALTDSNGKFYALCGISTDITERKAKEEALRQTNRALRVLSQCNSAVVHATEEQALLNEVCRVAVGPAGYRLAWVGYAEDDEARTVRPVASAGLDEGFLDRIHVSWADNQYGRGSIGPAIRLGKPVVVRRLRQQPTFSVWREDLASRNFESVMSVPLRQGDSVYGALAIYAGEPDAFDSSEVELIIELGENLEHGIASLRARKERAEAIAALERARSELEDRVRQRTTELEEATDAAASRTIEVQAKNLELEHEIGQRRGVEELLRARNEELKGFAYTVSHDLKAPLRGIAGYAHELERRHCESLNERALFCLKQILTATHNLDCLIEDLLHYSRLDAESPTPTECNLKNMVEAIIKDRKTVITDQGAEVSINLSATSVRTWERGLLQVLTNLIDNALKYSRKASPPRIHIASSKLPSALQIVVSDNGVGFDMKYHERIFGLFNRLVRQDEFEGTGAGLAIVKKVVDKLGGKIRAESTPGSGAAFFVELPNTGDPHEATA
jgi:PAS domain S-box-containing protein